MIGKRRKILEFVFGFSTFFLLNEKRRRTLDEGKRRKKLRERGRGREREGAVFVVFHFIFRGSRC